MPATGKCLPTAMDHSEARELHSRTKRRGTFASTSNTKSRCRNSIRWRLGICLGTFGLLLGAYFYLYADPWPGVFLAAMLVLLLLMQLVAPSMAFRRVYRRNPRMVGKRKVTISETGIVSLKPAGTAMRHSARRRTSFSSIRAWTSLASCPSAFLRTRKN